MKCSSGVLVNMQARRAIVALAKGAQKRLIRRIRFTRQIRRRAGFVPVVVAAELEAWNIVDRQPVVTAFLHLQVENREAVGSE